MVTISHKTKIIVISIIFFLAIVYTNISLGSKIDNLANNQGFSDILSEMKKSVVFIQSGNQAGTGFAIRSDGYILTASHLIENTEQISVLLVDGTSLNGTLYKNSINNRDLAIIKVESEIVPISICETHFVTSGQNVGFIGYPFGQKQQNVNEGIVTFYGTEDGKMVIKISSLIHSGDSGAPIFLSSSGKVIGVFTSGFNVDVPKMEADTSKIENQDMKTLAEMIINSNNMLASAIKTTSQTGMGTVVPISDSILSELP